MLVSNGYYNGGINLKKRNEEQYEKAFTNKEQLTFKALSYNKFKPQKFVSQNKIKIMGLYFLTSILSFLGIRKQSQTEKTMLSMYKSGNNEKSSEFVTNLENSIWTDIDSIEKMTEKQNNEYYSHNTNERKQIEQNIEKIMNIINSDDRFVKAFGKDVRARFESQQLNFVRNLGIEKMTDKANAQVRFMQEYLNKETLYNNKDVNENLSLYIEMIDSTKQVDFILSNLKKHQDDIGNLISTSFKFYEISKENHPSEEFVENFVRFSTHKDSNFYNYIYRQINIPNGQENEKKVLQAIHLYFGDAMPFEKMYNILKETGYLNK